ncbi:MAG: glutathione synthase [Betaproteobacteria bacterium]|nr:glutathione synthase [Betaproteobacteria bacterium]MDH3436409.1 glutathione synthase [Betaproteobacteria bacterium]
MKIAFVADPLDSFKIYKDTTFAIMREAARRGHALYAMEQEDLIWRGGTVFGSACRIHLTGEKTAWYRAEPASTVPLEDFDAVLMRKDPPFDMEYVYSTYLLELAEANGARVFNRPRAIRDWNEKLGIARFAQFAPPTLVTRRDQLIRDFLAEHGDVILKPLDGMGGTSVFRVRNDDPNVNVIIETVTHYGRKSIMAQRFIPEIRDGDKRVLLIAGKPVPYCLARVPRPGETRGNLAAGATGVARELTARDREIGEALGPALHREGLLLVGLDVIGDYLTEVNVTSPTCFQEIAEQTGFNVAGAMLDALETALAR